MDELAAYEGRLRRAGLPLLIEDYSAYEDIFTRAVPLLALVFGFQLLGAVEARLAACGRTRCRSPAASRSCSAASRCVNRRRGRRALSVPDRVGPDRARRLRPHPGAAAARSSAARSSARSSPRPATRCCCALIYGVVGIGLLSILALGRAARRRPARGVARAAHAGGAGAADLHDLAVPHDRDVAGLLGHLRRRARRRHRAVRRARLGLRRVAAAARGARARARRRRRAAAAPPPALQRRPRDVREPGAAGARRVGARRRCSSSRSARSRSRRTSSRSGSASRRTRSPASRGSASSCSRCRARWRRSAACTTRSRC